MKNFQKNREEKCVERERERVTDDSFHVGKRHGGAQIRKGWQSERERWGRVLEQENENLFSFLLLEGARERERERCIFPSPKPRPCVSL